MQTRSGPAQRASVRIQMPTFQVHVVFVRRFQQILPDRHLHSRGAYDKCANG